MNKKILNLFWIKPTKWRNKAVDQHVNVDADDHVKFRVFMHY